MNRNLAGASSALVMLACFVGFPQAGITHQGDEDLCNVVVDGDGEPVLERDSDRIAHSNSTSCPDEAVEEVAAVQHTSAEAPASAEAAEAIVEPLVVYFDVNERKLDAGSLAEINAYAVSLQATSPKGLKVVGYTDTSGSAELNQRLAEARANNVGTALIDAGVSAGMISRDASGEDELAIRTPDGTREAGNRRVTVTPVY
jgi:outer membrane protein OmpA-like peptidoglycan-associated protein